MRSSESHPYGSMRYCIMSIYIELGDVAHDDLPRSSAHYLFVLPSYRGYGQGFPRSIVLAVAIPGSEINSVSIFASINHARSSSTLVKMSNSMNFAGLSSMPKGLRSGAFATYCLRVYSSNNSGLFPIN